MTTGKPKLLGIEVKIQVFNAAVYNRYLNTFGGGELQTYSIATALARRGLRVDVVTTEKKPPSLAAVQDFFGKHIGGFEIKTLAASEYADEVEFERELERYSILVNNCAWSNLRNRCPLGLYMVMFPFQDRRVELETYHQWVANSEFTACHTRARWGEEVGVSTLYPACGDKPSYDLRNKQPEIVCVGRFNPDGHNKNQQLLVTVFKSLMAHIPKEWRLHLVGHIDHTPRAEAYVKELTENLPEGRVRCSFNVTNAEKNQILRQASLYWHATGMGRDVLVQPSLFEHFGISIVEAMSFGCVPICFRGGGPRETVEPGKSGFFFQSAEDLIRCTRILVNDVALRERMAEAAALRSEHFSNDRFFSRFSEILDRVWQ